MSGPHAVARGAAPTATRSLNIATIRTMTTSYRAAIVGLTGIGIRRQPAQSGGLRGIMPSSHVDAYVSHPRTELAAVCDLRPEAIDEFRRTWSDRCPGHRHLPRLRRAAGAGTA